MFEEKQFLYQNKIIWLVAVVMCIPIAILVFTFKGITPNFLLQCLLFLVIIFLMFRSNLYTKIDSSGIYYKMFPFINQLKFIDWEEIESIHVEKYEPIKEFGGWGYRGFKDNRALNTHGNLGIRIHLKEGNKILFGTNQEVAASAAIQAHFKKH